MRALANLAGTMTKKTQAPPSKTPKDTERRAAALRENLRRRKSQQRLRGGGSTKASVKDDG